MYRLIYVFSLAGMLFATSCIVPIQMSRVTLTESFTQSFDFDDSVNLTFGKLISDDKVSELEKTKWGKNVITQLKNKQVVSKGIASLTVSLVPGSKPEKFFISGMGFYDVIDTSSFTVYFSARFYLKETYYPLAILDTALSIPLYFNQVLINQIPYQDIYTRWHKPVEDIKVDIILDRSILDATRKPVFGLKYSAEHPVSIEGDTIGFIKFSPPSSPYDKIIDMRGVRSFIRRDYTKLTPKNSYP